MKKYFFNINDDDLKKLKINDNNYQYNKIINKYIILNFYERNIRLFAIFFILFFIFIIEIIDNSRHLILQKSRKYIYLCFKDVLINKYNNYSILNNNSYPKISLIIPLFNCEQTIKPVIRSIQNQNINDFEILLINDYSNDKTLEIIEGLAKNDSRIKIFNNNKNMGTLYSRCIGTLEAKGKYIFTLDNDDLFMDEDVLDVVITEAEKGDYDIVEFNAVRGHSYIPHIFDVIDDIYHDNPNNLVLHQPELGIHSITKNGKFESNNIHIWGKCLKSSLYKKAVNILGKERYSHFITWAEDTSIVFLLFNIAKSFKFISKYGVFHFMSTKTACYTQSNENKLFGELYLLDIMFDFSKNNFDAKKYIKLKALEIRQLSFFNSTIEKKSNKEYLKNILKKIINCKYIHLEDKNIIINYYRDFIY